MQTGEGLERRAVRAGGFLPSRRLEVHIAELCLAPGFVLGIRGAGRHGFAHHDDGLLDVTGHEPVIGHAVVTEKIWPQRHHLPVGLRRFPIPAHLHESIAQSSPVLRIARRGFRQLARILRHLGEVMAVELDQVAQAKRLIIAPPGEHLVDDLRSAIQIAEVGGFARFLDVGCGQ